jgi:hypothetical protein
LGILSGFSTQNLGPPVVLATITCCVRSGSRPCADPVARVPRHTLPGLGRRRSNGCAASARRTAALALHSAGSADLTPLRDLPPDAFAGPTRQLLEAHAALDCVAGGLWDGETLQPLVFSRKVYRGIPATRLVFAGNRVGAFAHLPAISRFLLRHKFLLLVINADRRERIAGSVFAQRTAPTFYKGPAPPAPGDFPIRNFYFYKSSARNRSNRAGKDRYQNRRRGLSAQPLSGLGRQAAR